ncbi:SMI1/KNR4 family protein [Exiguobacterium acetylicum]|uniref:SMI1/KNR4 family protein n=1 Tax=Exiguobacterium acetylicum TaxID=41170 RepID=UPI00387607B9
MKKLGTFTSHKGNLIVSDPAFLEPNVEYNVTIPVEQGSIWTVFYDEDEYESINLLYLTMNEETKMAPSDFEPLSDLVVVDSAQLVVMNTADYGRREAIDWEIRNTLEFDEEIDPFYIAISDEMMEEEIFLFPFGVAVQLMGDGHYEVLVRREDGNVTGIAIVLGEHEAFEEHDDEEDVSLEDVEIPIIKKERNPSEADDRFLANVLASMERFYGKDHKKLKYSIPIKGQKVSHELCLYDRLPKIQSYRVSLESPCPEVRLQAFETNHFAIPEWYKEILRVCNGVRFSEELNLNGVPLTSWNGLSHEIQGNLSDSLDEYALTEFDAIRDKYFFFGSSFKQNEYYAVLKERPDEAVYRFDYRTLKLKPKATTFQDIVRDAWRACNLKALHKRM